jgi:OOP family OmpA-OmpF porin
LRPGALRSESLSLSILGSCHATEPTAIPIPIAAARFDPKVTPPTDGALADQLVAAGKVVLGDLVFASGTTRLDDGPFASLDELAAWLKANPAASVALVGQADAQG